MKLFCKELGVPRAVIVDPNSNRTSDKVHQFYHKVGTTLCVVEETTQDSYGAELCIGLLKKSVGRDRRESDSSMKL